MPHHFCEGSVSLPRPASGQGNQLSQHSCLEEVVLLSLSLSPLTKVLLSSNRRLCYNCPRRTGVALVRDRRARTTELRQLRRKAKASSDRGCSKLRTLSHRGNRRSLAESNNYLATISARY